MSDVPPPLAPPLTDGPPPGSRIEVVERGGRLVLRVPAGASRANSILFFAVVWNAIAWVVAGVFWGVAFSNGVDWNLVPAGNKNGPVPWFVLPLTGLFPLIGVGLAFWWAKMRYTRTLLFAEGGAEPGAGKVAVRTEWLGRETTRTVALQPGDRATLEVAYEENDVPRYRVRVGPKGENDRTMDFGAMWSDAEVRWVAETVNRTLRVKDPKDVGIDDRDAPPRTVSVVARDVDSPHVRETLDARGRPVIAVRMWPGWPPGKRALVAFAVLFTLLWWTIVGFMILEEWNDAGANGNWAEPIGLLFCVPFVFAGLLMVSGLIAVNRATVRTTVAEESVAIWWGLGVLGYTRNVRRDRIRDVVVWENFGTSTDSRGTRHIPAAAIRVQPAGGNENLLPLSIGGGREVAEAVAAAVRDRLEDAGWEPSADDP